MPRCGDASGTLPDGERLAGVRALCDDQYRTVCFLGGHRELAAVSWRPEACVLLDDWRFFFRLRTNGGSAYVCGRESAENRASFRHSFRKRMNFRHSFVGNVLDGCRGGQGEDVRRFYKRFELPRRTTGGFSFVLDQLAKSLAEVCVFSKWLAENGALNDCFPPFFV